LKELNFIMQIKLIGSEETTTAQSPMVIPCTNWQVDERAIVKIRQQPVRILLTRSVEDECWRFLESHLETYAINFAGSSK
jgi:hypothetical protein